MSFYAGRRFVITDNRGMYLGKWRARKMPILLTVASVHRWISLLNDPENQLKVLVTGNKGNVAVFPLTQRGIMLMTPGANPEVEKYEVFATATAANLGTSPMKTFTTASALRRYIGKFCPTIDSPELSAVFIATVFSQVRVVVTKTNGAKFTVNAADVLVNSPYSYRHLVNIAG